jgi:hypothetical protein
MTSNATELLRRAQKALEASDDHYELQDSIEEFLAAEPEADEPVFIRPDHLALARKSPFLCRVEPKQRDDFIPLYTRPEPARKPMTEEEAIELCPFTREEFKAGFLTGVRFAEKHHGIGESE